VIGAEAEELRPPSGPGFTDAISFSFGDVSAARYGLVRLGIADGRLGSVLLVLFAGREPAAVLARGGIELAPGAGWDSLSLAGVRATVDTPHETWRLAFAGEGAWFDLAFAAVGAPAELGGAGTEGYEQLCRVTGTVTAGGASTALDCLGQRGHEWGVTDWGGVELTRTLAVWPDEGGAAIALHAARPAGAEGHDEEGIAAALLGAEAPVPVADPRLSTTYDGEGRQRRAGLELWVDEEEGPPVRAAGEVLCGSTLELGALRLDCAFLRWRVDGRAGVGRYDVLRRA